MSITVRIPSQLRNLTNGVAEIAVDSADTVGAALKELVAQFPELEGRMFDESGSLRRFVNVFLADEDIRFMNGLSTPALQGQTISVVPAVAGG